MRRDQLTFPFTGRGLSSLNKPEPTSLFGRRKPLGLQSASICGQRIEEGLSHLCHPWVPHARHPWVPLSSLGATHTSPLGAPELCTCKMKCYVRSVMCTPGGTPKLHRGWGWGGSSLNCISWTLWWIQRIREERRL